MNLRDELFDIRDRRGKLTADIVLEESTPEDHPLHSYFEWDNTIAGHAWRRYQAGQMLRSVKVTYTRANGTQGTVREFHALRDETGQTVYQPLDQIVESPLATELLRRQMRRDWESFRARYEGFEEFRQLLAEYTKAS